MDLRFAPELESFRAEAAAWLEEQLSGPFRHLRGLNNHVDLVAERRNRLFTPFEHFDLAGMFRGDREHRTDQARAQQREHTARLQAEPRGLQTVGAFFTRAHAALAPQHLERRKPRRHLELEQRIFQRALVSVLIGGAIFGVDRGDCRLFVKMLALPPGAESRLSERKLALIKQGFSGSRSHSDASLGQSR